jgi:protein-L-isoaspartate(D-aspartate) O-methyltransferase
MRENCASELHCPEGRRWTAPTSRNQWSVWTLLIAPTMTNSTDGSRRGGSAGESVPEPELCQSTESTTRVDPTAEWKEERLLAAVAAVPRRLFLPECPKRNVSQHTPIELAGAVTLPPVDVTLMMLRALDLTGNERVLEIGCGTGYQAALLARLAREVVSLEIDETRAARATDTLARLGCANVRVVHADGSAGWPELAPYQAIVVDAAVTELPSALLAQLDQNGRLVLALGEGEAQIVECMEKQSDRLKCTTIGLARLQPLVTTLQRKPSPYPWNHHG